MDILTSTTNGILTLEFNRPARKNAITSAMYQALADAIHAAEEDRAVRVILVAGQPDIFTAGNDLDDFLKTAAPADGVSTPDLPVFQFMRALSSCTKPVVAAVAGLAVGIGTTLLLHCDLVYAADNARFAMPFTQLGLCPEFGSSFLLAQVAGYPRAAEKLLLGDAFPAEEALAMGLVSRVLPAAELRAFAEAQAAKLAALPAASLRATKALMRHACEKPVRAAIAQESEVFMRMLQGPEAKEAFTAFFEKRKPDFSRFD
jgi:enoyl-CoA hydratase/carnithine racemase